MNKMLAVYPHRSPFTHNDTRAACGYSADFRRDPNCNTASYGHEITESCTSLARRMHQPLSSAAVKVKTCIH